MPACGICNSIPSTYCFLVLILYFPTNPNFLNIEPCNHLFCLECILSWRRKAKQGVRICPTCKVLDENFYNMNFSMDTKIFQGEHSSNLTLFRCIQNEEGWNSRVSTPLNTDSCHYAEFNVEVTNRGSIMLGFWVDCKKISNVVNESIGSNKNKSYGIYWDRKNIILLYGDDRSNKAYPKNVSLDNLTSTRIGLLLDLRKNSHFCGKILGFWKNNTGEYMECKGVLIEDLPLNVNYRMALSMYDTGDIVSWKGYSNSQIPDYVKFALSKSIVPENDCFLNCINSFDRKFSIDEMFVCSSGNNNGQPFFYTQNSNGWTSRVTHSLGKIGKHYIEFLIESTSSGSIIFGFWEDRKLIGENQIDEVFNKSIGYNKHNIGYYPSSKITTVFYNDQRKRRYIPTFRMDRNMENRRVGLLLDLDPQSPYFKCLLVFSSKKNSEQVIFDGILIENIPGDLEYRAAFSMHTINDRISWRGYSNTSIPPHIISSIKMNKL